MAKKLFYKIGEACKKVDVQPYVLRYWETEFDLLSPDKSKSGQRVYTEEDLGIIRRIKELLYDEGYTTVGAKKKLQAELAAAKNGTVEVDEPPAKGDKVVPAVTAKSPGKPAPEPEAAPQVEAVKSAAAPAESAAPTPLPAKAPGDTAGDTQWQDGVRIALKQAREILHLLDSAG